MIPKQHFTLAGKCKISISVFPKRAVFLQTSGIFLQTRIVFVKNCLEISVWALLQQ